MAVRKPLVIIGGILQEIPAADKLSVGGAVTLADVLTANTNRIPFSDGAKLADISTFTVDASGLSVAGSLNLTGTTTIPITTPASSTVQTRISIPPGTLPAFGQVMAMGTLAASPDTARVLSIFDARTVQHQPTMAVFNPAESDAFGLSWDGSDTRGYLKSLAGGMGVRIASTDVALFNSTGVSILGTLGVNGATALSSGSTAPTAAQFDNDTSIATTAYAMQIGLRSNGFINYTASATLTAADIGRACYYVSGSAGTLTLPVSASSPVGSILSISNIGVGVCTLARSSTDVIYAFGQTGVTSLTLCLGDTLQLYTNGSGWIQAGGSNGLGVGQTWQNVAGSRAASTTYTNSTGKPIEVVVTLVSSTGSAIYATVGGISFHGSSVGATGLINGISFIVPHNTTYSVVNNNGTSVVDTWAELRN
jgi:hypothetical protein